jgi:hypothetical protein
VYTDYCRMQKACNQLGETFRSESPAPAAASKIVDFKPRRRAMSFVTYAAGIAAAAACVAVAYVMRNDNKVAVQPQPSVAQAAPAIPVQSISRVETKRPELKPAFGPRSLMLRDQNSDISEQAASEQVAFADWINDVRLSTMEGSALDDVRFDGRAPLRVVAPVDPRAVRPFQGKVEMTAFKFQR